MLNKPLTTVIGDVAKFNNPLMRLDTAIEKYGDIKTFFTNYRNPIGIELEIEKVPELAKQKMAQMSVYWSLVQDSSLKVSGVEFVSCPISGRNIDYALLEASKYLVGDFLYSVRTSTHVHVNVSFMNYDEFVSLVLCSAYLEPLLYTMCEEHRKGNPYCYSITNLNPWEAFLMKEEMKYCGINLAPVRRQLTVEYRQLHGTNDWRLLRRWIQVLCKIYHFAKTTPSKDVLRSLREVIHTNNHEPLVKRILGASMILFPSLLPLNENLLWVLAALENQENT